MSIIEETTTAPVDINSGDHEKFAHVVVPKSAVTEAYVFGTPVIALCGKRWVPTRNPESFPVCPTCKEIVEMAGGKL